MNELGFLIAIGKCISFFLFELKLRGKGNLCFYWMNEFEMKRLVVKLEQIMGMLVVGGRLTILKWRIEQI